MAFNPTVSRLINSLAAGADGPRGALGAIDAARASASATAWRLAGADAPDHHTDARTPLTADIDARLVASHPEKECATPSCKKGFGYHLICAFVDHIAVAKAALAQLPGYGGDHGGGSRRRPGRGVLIRTDASGGTHGLIEWLTARRLSYSIGFTPPGTLADVTEHLVRFPDQASYPAVDGDPVDGKPAPLRDGHGWLGPPGSST